MEDWSAEVNVSPTICGATPRPEHRRSRRAEGSSTVRTFVVTDRSGKDCHVMEDVGVTDGGRASVTLDMDVGTDRPPITEMKITTGVWFMEIPRWRLIQTSGGHVPVGLRMT